MRSFADRWNSFWFEPASPSVLGFCRLSVMLGAFLFYRSMDFLSWGFLSPHLFTPIPLFEHLRWAPMGPMKMWTLGFVWKSILLVAALGLFSRTCCAIAFVLGLYLIGLPNNLGKVDHSDAILLWSFLVLAVGRSGDAWSIDSLIRSARKATPLTVKTSHPLSNVDHAEYRWPLRMMQVLMVTVFCCAGTTKLRYSGLAWAWSDNLRYTFLERIYAGHPMLRWGIFFAGFPLICRFVAVGALACETLSPLALFNRWLRRLIIPSLFMMQLGNDLLLGINFRQFMLCYSFWVPWDKVGAWLLAVSRRLRSTEQPTVVLFDGTCGLCTRTMAVLRRLDLLDRVEIIDVVNDWPLVAARYPSLQQDECLRVMHAISPGGKVTTGFFAYRQLAAVVPLGWLVWVLLFVPLVPTVGQAVYEKIANGRFRTACRIERPALSGGSGTAN